MSASILVVNHNGGEAVARTVRELQARAAGDAGEILVVDNASADGSPVLIRERAPGVRVVEEPENRGYAAGVNRGLREARGEVLLILNPDVLPEPGAVGALAEAVRDHPEFALLGGAVVDRAGRVDVCCARPLPRLGDILWEGFFLPKRRARAYRAVVRGEPGVLPVGAVSGAVLAVSRSNLDRLGPMNEEYFLYDEDLEWCERAHRIGSRVGVVPGARFLHDQGTTTRRDEALPFTARMLADFEFFTEFRGVSPGAVRWRWRVRQRFRQWLYAADATLGILGRRPASAARARIYRTLYEALGSLHWFPSRDRQNAHPDRLPELAGVSVPGAGGESSGASSASDQD